MLVHSTKGCTCIRQAIPYVCEAYRRLSPLGYGQYQDYQPIPFYRIADAPRAYPNAPHIAVSPKFPGAGRHWVIRQRINGFTKRRATDVSLMPRRSLSAALDRMTLYVKDRGLP